MYHRILVPLEREGASDAHLQHAMDLATKVGAELIPLWVIAVVAAEESFTQRVQIEAGSSGARRKAEAEAHMAKLQEQLKDRGIALKPAIIVSAKAEDEAIVDYCQEIDCELIVLPNQRRSLMSRWLQGNIAARVQRRSPVPVLFVREGE